jgi:hypothetical protein
MMISFPYKANSRVCATAGAKSKPTKNNDKKENSTSQTSNDLLTFEMLRDFFVRKKLCDLEFSQSGNYVLQPLKKIS